MSLSTQLFMKMFMINKHDKAREYAISGSYSTVWIDTYPTVGCNGETSGGSSGR